MFICSDNIVDGLYILTPDKHELYNSELDNNSHVKSLERKFPSTNDAYLWHLRLGHINSNMIQRLIKDGLLEPLDFDEFPVCESCLEGKMTKRPFNAKGNIRMYVILCQPKQKEVMSTSSLLQMITQDMVMCT